MAVRDVLAEHLGALHERARAVESGRPKLAAELRHQARHIEQRLAAAEDPPSGGWRAVPGSTRMQV